MHIKFIKFLIFPFISFSFIASGGDDFWKEFEGSDESDAGKALNFADYIKNKCFFLVTLFSFCEKFLDDNQEASDESDEDQSEEEEYETEMKEVVMNFADIEKR